MSQRILVIEDQPDNRQILRDLLTSADFEVLRGPTVRGPGEPLFPFMLRNMRRPDTLQWQPCAICRNSPLPRDGVPETEGVGARHKLDMYPVMAFASNTISKPAM
jgi:hypothetical protein